MVWSDPSTEGSRTTKAGTDEQESDMRRDKPDEVAHHTDVPKAKSSSVYHVDPAGIGVRKMLLPGEVSSTTCWL